jgi:hypothetical protein
MEGPLLTDIQILGYQSLSEVRLRLGRFTVLRGHTGAGKSSVVRAMQLVAFNAPGASYVSRGSAKCGRGLVCRHRARGQFHPPGLLPGECSGPR